MRSKQHKRALKVALHTAIITVLAVALSNTLVYSFTSILALKSSFEVKDYQISDLYTVIADSTLPRNISDNIVLMAVDDLSRSAIAEVICFVKEADAKVIGLDLTFNQQYEGDSSLILATSYPSVVLAESFDPLDNFKIHGSYFCNSTHKAAKGLTNIKNGVVRDFLTTFTLHDSVHRSFATEIARISGFDISKIGREELKIYFPSLDFWCIEPQMLIEQPEKCKGIMKGKIVLVGDMNDNHDMHQTPLGKKSGLWLLASMIETIIGKHDIKKVPMWINWTIAILSCILIVLFNLYLSSRSPVTGKLLFRLVQILLLYLYFWMGCMLFINYGICVDFAPALSTIAIGLLAYDIYFGLLAMYKKIIVKFNTRRK